MTPLASFLAIRWFPNVNQKVREALLILAGALWVALFAQVRIPLPFTPVPITGQTFAVLLIGTALGAQRGAAALVLYLSMGLSGLPVFAGGTGGVEHLAGPTGGYLIGFVLAAYVIGRMAERGLERTIHTSFLPFLVGTGIIYLAGVSWLALYIGLPAAIEKGLLPFLIGDVLKLLLASIAVPSAWKLAQGIAPRGEMG